MKFHKLVSRTIAATALLGITFGGVSSVVNVSANSVDTVNNSNSNENITNVVGSNGKAGTFNASSPTGMQINNSTLTLDSVPRLNFGNESNKNYNQSGSSTIPLNSDNSSDDNNSGLLEVTDYRQGPSNSGWNLQASMDPVRQDGGSTNNQNINNTWGIQLNNNNNANNKDNQGNLPSVNSTQLSNNSSQTASNYSPVMNSNGNSSNSDSNTTNGSSNGYGVNQIRYNTTNDAKLTTPNVAPGHYKTNINWQLSTNVGEENNYPTSTK